TPRLHSFHLTIFFLILPRPPRPTLFPYTTLFRSSRQFNLRGSKEIELAMALLPFAEALPSVEQAPAESREGRAGPPQYSRRVLRSEEHTSELQSRGHLVCRLLLEKKKKNIPNQSS